MFQYFVKKFKTQDHTYKVIHPQQKKNNLKGRFDSQKALKPGTRQRNTHNNTMITREMPEISERVRLAACVEYL